PGAPRAVLDAPQGDHAAGQEDRPVDQGDHCTGGVGDQRLRLLRQLAHRGGAETRPGQRRAGGGAGGRRPRQTNEEAGRRVSGRAGRAAGAALTLLRLNGGGSAANLTTLATRPNPAARIPLMSTPWRQIDVEARGDLRCVRLRQRRIEEASIDELGDELIAAASEEGVTRLVLSLGPQPPDCLYSIFLGKLIAVQRQLRDMGRTLLLCEAGPEVLAIFAACKL